MIRRLNTRSYQGIKQGIPCNPISYQDRRMFHKHFQDCKKQGKDRYRGLHRRQGQLARGRIYLRIHGRASGGNNAF